MNAIHFLPTLFFNLPPFFYRTSLNSQPYLDSIKISRCGIHGFRETLGIDQDEIRCYWILESDDEPSAQTAYQIVVREAGLGGAHSSGPVLWDSERCESSAQRDIVCKPKDGFRSTWAYWWQVSVWDHLHQGWHCQENEFFTAYPRSQLLPALSMIRPICHTQH